MAERSYESQVEQHYRYNFIVNVLDGTFFWGGASFIASTTILPAYVSRLTDSKLLIGLLSMIGSMGWLLPQLFTANRVQRLPRKKVWPIRIGLFTERLPVVLLALSVLLVPQRPTFALIAFYICYTWHAVGAGLVAVAWQAMVGKVIPDERRGKFFGLTNFLGTATGVAGAVGAGSAPHPLRTGRRRNLAFIFLPAYECERACGGCPCRARITSHYVPRAVAPCLRPAECAVGQIMTLGDNLVQVLRHHPSPQRVCPTFALPATDRSEGTEQSSLSAVRVQIAARPRCTGSP